MSGVLSGKSISKISVGSFVSCVIAESQLYCWGSNNVDYGTLGNNLSPSTALSPVLIQGALSGKSVSDVSVGNGHACAVADDDLFCWGYNSVGQVGDGTFGSQNNRLVPTAVNMGAALAGKTITAVDTGVDRTCVLDGDRYVYCWGFNGTGGGIGNNSMTNNVYLPLFIPAYSS
jgi:alpha-tubulin suppressor-like RCC1 family protein